MFFFEISIRRLKKSLDLSAIEATPICLLKPGERNEFTDLWAKVVGWGMPDEHAGATTRLLQKLDVPVMDSQHCANIMNFDLTDRMMCAGFDRGGKDACMVLIS
jgi:hypothetical protein